MSDLISHEAFDALTDVLIMRIREAKYRPDYIVALSTGGFPVAAALAKALGVNSRRVVGLPVFKDQDGGYYLDEGLVALAPRLSGTFLVVDEASNRGLLTRQIAELIEVRGAQARSCVLLAREAGLQPDFVASRWVGKPPKFYWEAYAEERRGE